MSKQPAPTVSLVRNFKEDDAVPVGPIKRLVTDVLQLPAYLNKYWDIIDYYPSQNEPELVLAHYNDGYEPYNRQHTPLRRVRGVIVDVNIKAIVADSYGYTQNLPCYGALQVDSGPEIPEGSIQLQTEIATYMNNFEQAPEETPKINYGTRSFESSRTKLFLGYEGAMARIFKWKGEVFFSTHRRINAIRSNWGGRTPFYELYQKLGGPPLNSLFGDESYSPYCYMFLIVDDAIRIASSTRDNRVIFIGVKKVWDPKKYPQWGNDFELNVPQSGEEPSVFSPDLNRALTIQPTISPEMANKFLFPNSYAEPIPDTEQAKEYNAKENELIVDYNADATAVDNIYFKRMTDKVTDDRLAGGDFVILYYETDDGHTLVYRLEPSSFEYRIMITGNDPNLYHRFVVEMVNFTKADPAELKSVYPKYDFTEGEVLSLDDTENRQIYWWSLFYDAVPPSYREEVDGYLRRYQRDLNKVADFIISEYPKIFQNAEGFENAEKIVKAGELIGAYEQQPEGHDESKVKAAYALVQNVQQLNTAKKIVQSHEELRRINQDTQNRFNDLRRITVGASYTRGQSPYVIMKGLLMKETGPSFYKMITTVRNIGKYRDRLNKNVTSTDEIINNFPTLMQSSQ